jgi:predicted transcriptional regulator
LKANVKAKLAEEIDRLEEAYATELQEEIATTKAELVEKVDSYLNYVVEQWMEDNALAIQSGLRAEIAEDFMKGLKNLFTESYVDVPEAKVDLVDELSQQVEEMAEKLNGSTEAILEMAAELETFKREAVIREASEGLAATQVAKLRTMVEGFDFDDEFAHKVAVVKESVFSAKKATASEEIVEDEALNEEVSSTMASYLSAIKTLNN